MPPSPATMFRSKPSVPSFCLLLIALASAAMRAPAQAEALQARVDRALAAARPALLLHLKNTTRKSARPGALALVLMAAVHDGVDQGSPLFQRAVKRLAKARCRQTYDLALRLMVMQLVPTFPGRGDLAHDDVEHLLTHRDEGAFGYSKNTGKWDLSNTQYAALGLRAASALQVPIPKNVWFELADAIGRQQFVDGGFGYQRSNSGFPGYPSMTAAGIAVLAVCRQALGTESPSGLDDRIDLGWRYFDRNVACIGSATEHWNYYFLYGLERAAILCDVDKVKDRSWYELGAELLVREQLDGGGWRGDRHGEKLENLPHGRGSAIATSFAVLFLRRNFQKVLAPITANVVRLVNIGPASKAKDIEACARQLQGRGKAALRDVLRALRSQERNQRRAAAMALAAIAGKGFGYDPALDCDANRASIRKAELWYLRNR